MADTSKYKVSDLEEHLGFWMRRVSNHVSQQFADALVEREIAVAEWVLLRVMFDAAAEPSALAARIGMTRGAVTKLVDKLVAKGLVRRLSREDDRRFQTVELTAAGRKMVPVLSAIADRNDAECFAALSKDEGVQLMRMLKKLAGARALNDVPIG